MYGIKPEGPGFESGKDKNSFSILNCFLFSHLRQYSLENEKEKKRKKMQNSQNALLHLILKSLICGLKCVVRRQSARIGFSLSLIVFSPIDRNRQKSGPATDPHVNIYFLKAGTDNAARIS